MIALYRHSIDFFDGCKQTPIIRKHPLGNRPGVIENRPVLTTAFITDGPLSMIPYLPVRFVLIIQATNPYIPESYRVAMILKL